MADFKPFSKAVHQQFTTMSKHELFTVDISGDDLFAAYLAAFPEGTNPIYRERTEHDCSCWKIFIRNILLPTTSFFPFRGFILIRSKLFSAASVLRSSIFTVLSTKKSSEGL